MGELKRQRVVRPDGKAINLVQRRGHLSYCYDACCCGRTDRGFAPVPVDLYKSEWLKRKYRNVVHLTKGGCLGPCTLANVATLLFDGNSVWFHSVNSDWQVKAIFDYIESMIAADCFLVPPAELTEYVFQFYSWKGPEHHLAEGAMVPSEGIVFLTHADTDLLTLHRTLELLPEDFPKVTGINLQAIKTDAHMAQILSREIASGKIIILRILGRPSSLPGFNELLKRSKENNQHLIVVSGTGELNPEFAAISTVTPSVLHETLSYFQASGHANFLSLLKYLSDKLLFTGYGYDAPIILPEHGIYHPELPENATMEDWKMRFNAQLPTIGITFYRAHYVSGNTTFIDLMINSLEERNLNVLPVFTTSLKSENPETGLPFSFDFFRNNSKTVIDVLINTISFAMHDVNNVEAGESPLSVLDVPVLQAITSGMQREIWQSSGRGLNPLDTAMNVAIPEFDGRIITVPISFKEKEKEVKGYEPLLDRIERVAGIAARFSRLKQLPNQQQKIAFIFTNSSSKASQIGNAVGLDAPASLMNILTAMEAEGYHVRDLPESGTELIKELIDRCSYDKTYLTSDQLYNAVGRISKSEYSVWFDALPGVLKDKIFKQWGPPPGESYVHDGHISFAGLELGNVLVALQPPRGYGMDPDAIYHQPDLPPTHHYFAFYRWLSEHWKADAIVHVGKHGTLEWLPGKGIGLSENCFPDALLGDMPLFYPFIINDPGEGSQAKRRAHAVVVDHLTPPMTSADSYGDLAELTQLVDEYYQVEALDPAKLPLLQKQIWQLIQQTNLDKDLSAMLSQNHGDHVHDWDEALTPEGVPVSIAEMDGKGISHLIEDIDGYLCELGAAQIRNGLHILGEMPQGTALVDMLQALTRLANIGADSFQSEAARFFNFDLGELTQNKGKRLTYVHAGLKKLADRDLISAADVLEEIDSLTNLCFQHLLSYHFNPESIERCLVLTFGDERKEDFKGLSRIMKHVCDTILPNLGQTYDEINNLLHGLSGGYIPAGPSGAPTRGMAHILPTGRNFYTSDPRSLPSKAAWEVGQKLAEEVLKRHVKETGLYPENVGISIWGTSAMRTQGDDVAEILALMGVRPVWQSESRRVEKVEVIPLTELNRPRIDVTTRISGFFRDAFPHLIELIDQAVQLVAVLDEPPEQNFIRKHYLIDLEKNLQTLSVEEAEEKASYRIFGSPPGSYGAGILPLMQEKNWQTDEDITTNYINWGGYAYSGRASGTDARAEFRERLSQIEVALHNQDNREHDIFDSDDYFQFHGGMIASIRSITGAQPKAYFGDSQDPSRPSVRTLKEEALRVFRSRVVNPKWLESIQKHGYKGGLELTATVDYIFGYDATAKIADDWMYEKIAEVYALAPDIQEFFEKNNPWALHDIAERLLEAAQRKMWENPSPETLIALESVLLKSETMLEERSETGKVSI